MAIFRRERGNRGSRLRVGQKIIFRRIWQAGDRKQISVVVRKPSAQGIGLSQPVKWKWAITPTSDFIANEVKVHRRGQPRSYSRTAPVSHTGNVVRVRASRRNGRAVRAHLRRAAGR